MDITPAPPPLARFRAEFYQRALGLRRDALFALGDAVLAGAGPTSLVRRSLAPPFRRRWASAPDALADGTLDAAALRRLFTRALPAPPAESRPLWALDGSTWPRPAAKTSPERTYERCLNRGRPQAGIVAGWEYQWLVAVPEADGSWVLPLDVARRAPAAGSPTQLAICQLRAVLAQSPATAPRPVVTLDSHDDAVALIGAELGVDLLVRLAGHRRFHRRPGPYRGRGRRPIHGPLFRCKDPATHGTPDRTRVLTDPDHGRVVIDVWEHLHTQPAATVEFAVVRVQPERLPRRARPPAPLWLAWHGGPLPDDLALLWRWYERRFAVEHGFRLLKQDLGWTTIRPRAPQAADRWGWLLAAALWQLWLARPLVADQRLPWERPLPPGRLTPGRVRRAFGGLLAIVGTPAKPPCPRGKAPGRQPGQRPGPAPRQPVQRRAPPTAA
ncbi:MAG: transposase [Candidatus Limnocylindria bacterium]